MIASPSINAKLPGSLFSDGQPKQSDVTTPSTSTTVDKRKIAKSLKIEKPAIPPYAQPIQKLVRNTNFPDVSLSDFSTNKEWDVHLLRNIENKVLTLCCIKVLHDETKCGKCDNIKPSLRVALKTQGHRAPIATTCNLSLNKLSPRCCENNKSMVGLFEIGSHWEIWYYQTNNCRRWQNVWSNIQRYPWLSCSLWLSSVISGRISP